MISCTLNEKKYTVDFVSGRALREMEPAAQMYGRIVAISNAALKGEVPEEAKNLSISEALDVNGDGKKNFQDATDLLQYIAGWDVVLH